MQKKSYNTFVIDPRLMMAQSRAESTWEKQLWEMHQSIPTEYYNNNTPIWKDQQENM